MAGKKGPRGRRSPCPNWWVDEANRRLRLRSVTKKTLAGALQKRGLQISETMVVRCLLEDEANRIPTIEAMDAISDALGIPRPVVVAESIEQALEVQAAVHFSLAHAQALELLSDAEEEARSRSQPLPRQHDKELDGGTDGQTEALGGGRARAAAARRQTVRRAPRDR